DAIARAAAAGEARVAGVASLEELRTVEAELLGKRSELAEPKAKLGTLDPGERREMGQAPNDARARLPDAVARSRRDLAAPQRPARLEAERVDLPEVPPTSRLGHLHLVTQALERLEDVFVGLGFTVAEGPEVETDWHNFGALN